MEKMSANQVRTVKDHLRTQNIEDRHVNCVCRIGHGRLCGQVVCKDGNFYLQSKDIKVVRMAMKKEKYVPKGNKDGVGSAWSNQNIVDTTNCAVMPNQRETRQPFKRGDKIFHLKVAPATA